MSDFMFGYLTTHSLAGLLAVLLSARWHGRDRMPWFLAVFGWIAFILVLGVQVVREADNWLDAYAKAHSRD